MRSKFAMFAVVGMVLGMAGLTTAQNTNTNTNTSTDRTNTNSNRNTNNNSNRSTTSNTNNNSNSNRVQTASTRNNNSGRVTGAAAGAMSALDSKFAMDAAYANNAEIAAGRQALTKSTNPDVQRYAQMMIDHHTQANADLARMNPGVTLPTGLHPHHQAVADGHAKLSGTEFDMAYIKGQIADHAMTLDMLDTYDDDGKNRDLKGYADKSEPIVKQHLTQAKALEMRMTTGMAAAPNARPNQ